MAVLKDKDKRELEKLFAGIRHAVKIVMFTQESECEYCEVTRELVTDIGSLSPQIAVEVHDFTKEAELAASLGVDKIPAIAVMADEDYGIRFFGVPAGYELGTLVEAILAAGKREHGLSASVLAEVEKIDRPVHLQVLITPT